MGIALDTSAAAFATLNNVSYTVTGLNTILIAFPEGSANNVDTISAVSYGGVAMTQIDKLSTGAAGSAYQYSYILINPPTGAHTFAVTGGCTAYSVASYTGVLSVGQPDAHNTFNGGSGSSGTISLATVTVADNDWVVAHFRAEGLANVTLSNNANATVRSQFTGANGGGGITDTNGVVHPAGSITQTVNISSATGYRSVLSIAISPIISGSALWFSQP